MMRKTRQLSDPAMKVSYLEAGQGSPLLLIHGVGMNAASWAPQIETLQRFFRVIAVDMPGHGASEGFNHPATLEDYVAWIAAFLRARPEKAFAVAGHSMGALIAAGLAIEHPEQVSHAIIMSGVYQRSEEARAAVMARATELASGDAQLDSPLARWFSDTPEEAALRARVSEWLKEVDPKGYARAYQAFAAGDAVYASRWKEMRCPVMVLTGELDANSSPAMARSMAAAAPQGRAVIISNAKHMVSLTDAPRVNEEILAFLRPTASASQPENAGVTDER